MTASKPQKQKPPCPSGIPHHWVIANERDMEGFFPAECRNCGGCRRFSGAVDPDYFGVYTNFSAIQVRYVRGKKGRSTQGTYVDLLSDPND